jgi:hypothetical protein
MFVCCREAAFLEAFWSSRTRIVHGFAAFVKNDERRISSARQAWKACAKFACVRELTGRRRLQRNVGECHEECRRQAKKNEPEIISGSSFE